MPTRSPTNISQYHYTFTFDAPYVTVTEFSRRTGVPENTVRKYIKEGHLPVLKKEKSAKGKVLINLLIEAQRVLNQS